MTLLQLVQAFCQRTGITVPTQVAGNTDSQIIQVMALLNEVIEDMVNASNGETWQILDKEAVFTTLAAEDQGALTTLAPYGYLGILQGTIFSRTQQLPSYGPISPIEWQQLKAMPVSGPFYKYRLWQGHLYLYPAPPAGHTYAFEYGSNYAVLAVDGTTFKPYYTADDDTCILPEMCLMRGLRWKWKKEKGLEYDEEFREYQLLMSKATGRDKTSANLYGSDPFANGIQPGIWVSPGSWNLP